MEVINLQEILQAQEDLDSSLLRSQIPLGFLDEKCVYCEGKVSYEGVNPFCVECKMPQGFN